MSKPEDEELDELGRLLQDPTAFFKSVREHAVAELGRESRREISSRNGSLRTNQTQHAGRGRGLSAAG